MTLDKHLLQLIQEDNRFITKLDLFNDYIDTDTAIDIAKALINNHYVKKLSFNYNRSSIGIKGIAALADMFTKNQSLAMVYLEDNEIDAEGAKLIFTALNANHSIYFLTLAKNKIGSIGTKALAALLKANNTLVSLDLSANQIKGDSIYILADALMVNTSLTTLNLRQNCINDREAIILEAAIANNYSLTSLDLFLNGLTEETKARISQKLEDNQKKAEQLIKAAETGDFAKVQALVANGVALNYQDEDGDTALHKASAKDYQDIINFLANQPSQMLMPNKKGIVPATSIYFDWGHGLTFFLGKKPIEMSKSSYPADTEIVCMNEAIMDRDDNKVSIKSFY